MGERTEREREGEKSDNVPPFSLSSNAHALNVEVSTNASVESNERKAELYPFPATPGSFTYEPEEKSFPGPFTRHTPQKQWNPKYKCDPLHAEEVFNFWRLGPPETPGKQRKQTSDCQRLATLGDLEDIIGVKYEMKWHDPRWWSKEENAFRIEAGEMIPDFYQFLQRRKTRLAKEQSGIHKKKEEGHDTEFKYKNADIP